MCMPGWFESPPTDISWLRYSREVGKPNSSNILMKSRAQDAVFFRNWSAVAPAVQSSGVRGDT